MKPILKKVSEIIAQANDQFYAKHTSVDTLLGIMDKALRKQGLEADAVTLDAPVLDKKIVFLLHDSKPDTIDIAFGNKEGVIASSNVIKLESLTIDSTLDMMESTFLPVN